MNRPVRRLLCALPAAAGASALVGARPASAQAWPERPVRVIVNFPPGGVADVIARAVAPPLAEAIAQPVVVENRAGANGNVGAEAVAKAPPDGHTLLMSSGGAVSVNPHLYPKMAFDPVRDLQPVAAAARVLVYLVVRPDLPVRDVREMVAYMRSNPGRLSYGSAGNGSSPHIAGEMFKSAGRLFAVHVPYRGAAPALTDLLGGNLDYMFDPGIGLAHVRSGKLRLLAVGSPKRAPMFPEVPTLAESGMSGFDADTWFGFYAPSGVPAPIVDRLNREINRILQAPSLRERIASLGGEAVTMTPSEFEARARADRERFGRIIREARITVD